MSIVGWLHGGTQRRDLAQQRGGPDDLGAESLHPSSQLCVGGVDQRRRPMRAFVQELHDSIVGSIAAAMTGQRPVGLEQREVVGGRDCDGADDADALLPALAGQHERGALHAHEFVEHVGVGERTRHADRDGRGLVAPLGVDKLPNGLPSGTVGQALGGPRRPGGDRKADEQCEDGGGAHNGRSFVSAPPPESTRAPRRRASVGEPGAPGPTGVGPRSGGSVLRTVADAVARAGRLVLMRRRTMRFGALQARLSSAVSRTICTRRRIGAKFSAHRHATKPER